MGPLAMAGVGLERTLAFHVCSGWRRVAGDVALLTVSVDENEEMNLNVSERVLKVSTQRALC